MKICKTCGEFKPLDSFAVGGGYMGRRARCKTCINADEGTRYRERTGAKPVNLFTEEDRKRLSRDYLAYRDAGTLALLATDMGRTKQFVCRQARTLGLTDPKHNRVYGAVWKYMPEEVASAIFEKFKRAGGGLLSYCKRKGYDDLGFSTTMRKFFPDEYEHVIEAKQPRQTPYRLGRSFEYRVRDHLREKGGYFVLRSPASRTPIDLAAIRPGVVLFVQCKRGGAIGVIEWNKLLELSLSCGAIPVLAAMDHATRYTYTRITGPKDGSKGRQPHEPFDPLAYSQVKS